MRYILSKPEFRIIKNSITGKHHIINTSKNKIMLLAKKSAIKLSEFFEVEMEYKTPEEIKAIKRELAGIAVTRYN